MIVEHSRLRHRHSQVVVRSMSVNRNSSPSPSPSPTDLRSLRSDRSEGSIMKVGDIPTITADGTSDPTSKEQEPRDSARSHGADTLDDDHRAVLTLDDVFNFRDPDFGDPDKDSEELDGRDGDRVFVKFMRKK